MLANLIGLNWPSQLEIVDLMISQITLASMEEALPF
jgi:hypothetical protein